MVIDGNSLYSDQIRNAATNKLLLPKTLTDLDISRVGINDPTFISALNLLQRLDLYEKNVTDTTLIGISANCLQLHTLFLGGKLFLFFF